MLLHENEQGLGIAREAWCVAALDGLAQGVDELAHFGMFQAHHAGGTLIVARPGLEGGEKHLLLHGEMTCHAPGKAGKGGLRAFPVTRRGGLFGFGERFVTVGMVGGKVAEKGCHGCTPVNRMHIVDQNCRCCLDDDQDPPW